MNAKIKLIIINFFKGILFGGANIVPGIGGGTFAYTSGLHKPMLTAINTAFKGKKEFLNALYILSPILLGCAVGVIALAKAIEFFIGTFALPTFSLFAGLIIGSIPMMAFEIYHKEENNASVKFKITHLIPVILGAVVLILPAIFVKTGEPQTDTKSLTFGVVALLFCGGLITSLSMIAPGVSASFMLILMGIYRTIITAIGDFFVLSNFVVLLIFGAGVIVGILLFARAIDFLITRFKVYSYLAIIGLLIGATVGVFLREDTYSSGTNAWGIVCAVGLFLVGTVGVLFLTFPFKFMQKKDV
jgi:putative membrane protein